MRSLWPHQSRGIADVIAAYRDGYRRVLLTSPTGMGKTEMVTELIKHYAQQGFYAVVYTNRRLLIEQLDSQLTEAGLLAGVRAAGHQDRREKPIQISSVPTETSRTFKRQAWQLHGFGRKCLAVLDEAHLQNHKSGQQLVAAHVAAGHLVLLVTATPIGLGNLADHLVVAGTTTEGRACGALVRCHHYGPDEPDLRHVKRLTLGEDLSEPQLKSLFPMTQQLFGRVFDWFDRLNPDRKPTILFASGVAESIWFAEEFTRRGVPAAHIDGSNVWLDGEFHPSSREKREEVLYGSESGRVRVVCNRFVLREGVDAPWLAHGILATTIGSVQSYLQAGGRLLRAHPSLAGHFHVDGERPQGLVTLQDHGGNWWRHGSLNADRHWRLEYTSAMLAGLREDGFRTRSCRQCGESLGEDSNGTCCSTCGFSNLPEPRRCDQCGLVVQGRRCSCGCELPLGRKARPVVMIDGSVGEVYGDIFKPRKTVQKADTQKLWDKCYWRARNSKDGMTFKQAEGLFVAENHYWPPRTLFRMPNEPFYWWQKVRDVPREKLNQPQHAEDQG